MVVLSVAAVVVVDFNGAVGDGCWLSLWVACCLLGVVAAVVVVVVAIAVVATVMIVGCVCDRCYRKLCHNR